MSWSPGALDSGQAGLNDIPEPCEPCDETRDERATQQNTACVTVDTTPAAIFPGNRPTVWRGNVVESRRAVPQYQNIQRPKSEL